MSPQPTSNADQGLAVLAFGGNALLPDPFHPEEQEERAADLARVVTLLLERSSGLVLVHGNGPQVGMILLRVEHTRERLPVEPLDMLVAETQGSIGYLLSRALYNALHVQGSDARITSILSQVVVDADDEAFSNPTKPIGPFYDEESARLLRDDKGWQLLDYPGKGWRRVVPSPRPREVIEMDAIREAAQDGHIVIAGGGGGIPVYRDANGEFNGVEGVIDKDLTSALLAVSLGAQRYIVLTGVPHVARDFASARARRIKRLTPAEALVMASSGVFPPGTMGPKVEAAAEYVQATGREALITDMANLTDALEGREGTRIAE